MDFVRIGKKLVSKKKINANIDKIIDLRSQGNSQRETADILGLDRSFISRLENMGEVRRGGRIALIGFPVKNKEELQKVASREGIDFVLLMTEEERLSFLRDKSGVSLFNNLMSIIKKIRDYDTVIIIGSDERIKIVEAILDKEIIALEIGKSPLKEDVCVDIERLEDIIGLLK